MAQIINLTLDDDLISIQSQLELTKAKRVLMIVPSNNKTLHSQVNLKMVARTAKRLNIELALVSRNVKIRDFAKEAGLKVYASQWFAKLVGFISTTESPTPTPKKVAKQLPKKSVIRKKLPEKVLVFKGEMVTIWKQLVAFLLIPILALAFIVIILAIVPQGTVTLTPQTDSISTKLIITADPNPEVTTIDRENNITPARPVQTEVTLFTEVPTIAQENAPADFALGEVTFFNRTQIEQTIPMSTIVRTSSGVPVEFLTTYTATIPAGAGQTTTTTVRAVEPGSRGNVLSGQINNFLNPTLGLISRVFNEGSTHEGAERPTGVVTENDKDRVRSKLRQLIQKQGYEDIVAGLDEQEFVPPESLLVIELSLSYNKFSGDVSETLGAEMRAVVRGTAVGTYHANQLAYFSLLEQVPDDESLLSEGLKFSAGGIQEIKDRTIIFPIIAEGVVVSKIDKARVKSTIAFMPIGEAQAWMSQNLAIEGIPAVEIRPNLLGRLPLFPFFTTIVINDVTAVSRTDF